MFGASLPKLDYPIYIIKFLENQPDEKYSIGYTSGSRITPPPDTKKTTSKKNDGPYDLSGLAYAVTKAPPTKAPSRRGPSRRGPSRRALLRRAPSRRAPPKNKTIKSFIRSASRRVLNAIRGRKRRRAPPPPPPPKPFFNALSEGMIYQIEFGNINTLSKLNSLYSNLSTKIMSYMGDGNDPRNNLAALIYFMVVIENKFKEFTSRLPYYNYLQATYPNVFTNDNVYRKFVVIKYYFESLIPLFNTFEVSYKVRYRKLFGRTHYRTNYKNASIGIEDSVMKYMVPVILKEIKLVLDDNNDIPDTNDLPETAFFSG